MILFIKDRLAIIQLLPQNGSISEMIDIMEILKKVRIEHNEKIETNFRVDDGNLMWDSEKDTGKEVNFSFEEISILKNAVKELDINKKITKDNLDICIKITKL